ncbi:hypothetical protein COCVIDRAFT_13379 [Bipolaris victoriae FI3]|uniref:Uncharacterized protein n=1 Tax=Bipolaris victoriae (strain FI3) TaxID=930091 RepID=W7ESS2_BIPV3|nr:hypothetical protein COCVIDRAFT_13379 [Bipolaris victoriae FI3]
MDCGEGAQAGSRLQPNGVEHGSMVSSPWVEPRMLGSGQRGARGAMVKGMGDGGWWHGAFWLLASGLWLLASASPCGKRAGQPSRPTQSFARGLAKRDDGAAHPQAGSVAQCVHTAGPAVFLGAEDWPGAVGT